MRSEISQIIDGKLYNTETATLVASNEFWDGHNFERNGRNKHLYRTKKGNFFVGYSTLYEGEHDYVEPIGESSAMDIYEGLSEHDLEYSDAFGVEPEEA